MIEADKREGIENALKLIVMHTYRYWATVKLKD